MFCEFVIRIKLIQYLFQ